MTETTRTEVRTETQSAGRRHRAGAFDIRNFVASLIGLFAAAFVLWARLRLVLVPA